MDRRHAVRMLAASTLGAGLVHQGEAEQPPSRQDYIDWVSQILQSIERLKPGMTRFNLMQVFTTEGGPSIPLERTFVTQACPYIKVHVVFEAIGRPQTDEEGRETNVEDPRDRILSITRPYLQFSITD